MSWDGSEKNPWLQLNVSISLLWSSSWDSWYTYLFFSNSCCNIGDYVNKMYAVNQDYYKSKTIDTSLFNSHKMHFENDCITKLNLEPLFRLEGINRQLDLIDLQQLCVILAFSYITSQNHFWQDCSRLKRVKADMHEF